MSLLRAIHRLATPATLLTAIAMLGCSDAGSDEPSNPKSQVNDDDDPAGKAESWDDANAPSMFGLSSLKLEQIQEEKALRGFLPEKPWADTYWPLDMKGMSDRWISRERFETFEAQRESAIAALNGSGFQATWKLSPAEKYDILVGDTSDTGYGMTKEGWDVYKKYEDYEHDWSWMGHCHGWAPAAYLESTPKASVLANINGREVLFTEGDIRGLLTKAHASNSTSGGTRFLGTRCNARTIIRDEKGRIVDGTLYVPKADAPKEANTEAASTIYIDRNFWASHHILTYTESIRSDAVKVLRAAARAAKPDGAFVVDSFASIADYQAGTVEKKFIFVYNKECRDTNAGAFHLVLAEFLSDRNAPKDKRGFVMDVTREDQVWNQPAYGFESTIESVQNAADIEDPLADFRAEGTVQIAKVVSEVHYGLENGPYISYSDYNSSHITSKTYEYTLEIDAEGYVIGGEWVNSSSGDQDGSTAPDFLWAPQGPLMDSEKVSYSELSKLHKCSLEADKVRGLELPNGSTIKVVDCQL